jgi:hypothetical protein
VLVAFLLSIYLLLGVENKSARAWAEIWAPGKGPWRGAELFMSVMEGGTSRRSQDSLENKNPFPLSL